MTIRSLHRSVWLTCVALVITACGGGSSGSGSSPTGGGAQLETLTITESGSGSVTSSPSGISCSSGSCSAGFASGTSVTLTAQPASGYSFSGWGGACSGTGNCTVTMSAAQLVTASFSSTTPGSDYVLTLSETGQGTVSSNPAGINCNSSCYASFASGTSVTLSAQPASGYTFAGWGGACSGTGSCAVTMNSALSVTATFAASGPSSYVLTVGETGLGLVSSNPTGISCGATCSASFASGSTVTLSAQPASGYAFAGWGGACSGVGTCTVAMNSALSVSAAFTPVSGSSYSLTVSEMGTGTVTSSPAGISCGSACTSSFASGTVVTLAEQPGSGYVFSGWGGACSGTGTCAVTMSADQSVSATFSASAASYTLQVTKSGSGTVTSTPAGISCGSSCASSFTTGTMVTLSEQPASGYTFSGWGGACSGTGSCSVTMNSAMSVSASFSTSGSGNQTLTVTESGTGTGSVTSSPAGINCGATCSASFAHGTAVTLTAQAASGSTFAGWSGACSGTGTCAVTMSAAMSVTASFTASSTSGAWPPPVQLTSSPGNCVTAAITAPSGSTTYNVGPGQQYATLTTVPWLSLKPGDVVNIYYQPTPYATVIAITAIGTAAKPVIINGVTDASCNRPILTGANAVIAADALASNYWTQSPGSYMVGNGLINFAWAPTDPNLSSPAYITIQNLEVTGAASGQTFTDAGGAAHSWADAYGIYAVMFSYVTIQNCLVHGNDGGVFFNSQDPPRTSYYVTLRNNYIYGNGRANSFLDHNIYGQGYRTLYEGNYLGQEISTAQGSTLKDRSSGPVIRYNYIVASLRAIDLVDSETDDTVINDPLYAYAWIYGNVIVDDFALPLNSGDLIHWGGDSTIYTNYHVGTLYFYFNTLIVQNNTASYNPVGIFDMPLNSESVEAHSNIFYFNNNTGSNSPVGLGICCGTITFDNTNWISTGFATSANNGSGSNSVTFKQDGTLLQGTNPLINPQSQYFTLSATSGSPAIGAGTLFPTSAPSSSIASIISVPNLQPSAQYANQSSTAPFPSIVSRPTASDLGAYAAH